MPGTFSPRPPGAEPGEERLNGALPFDAGLRARIHSRLLEFETLLVATADLRRAAVTIALVAGPGGEAACLLTQRPMSLRRHPGQFALPGGRVDAGESEAEAALRELHEELGLAVEPSAILGTLDDYATQSGFRIRPFVVWIEDDSRLEPDPREVARCFRVPLAEIAAPPNLRLSPVSHSEHPRLSLCLPTLGNELNAPTAALLYQFSEVALGARPTRVGHYAQPRFTWR